MDTSNTLERLQLEEMEIAKQRERFLLNILIGTLIFGVVALVLVFIGTTTVQYKITYTAIIVVMLAVLLFPLSYSIRAWGLSLVFLSLGAITLVELGIRTEGFLFVYASVVLASILLNTRQAVIFLLVNEITIGVLGWLTIKGFVTPVEPSASIDVLDQWIAGGIASLLLAWITIAGLRMLHQASERPKKLAKEIAQELFEERKTLEERVIERTQELENRTNQLNATTYVARQTAEIHELSTMLQDTVKLITEQFGFYHAGIFLINERGDYAILHSASSEGGKQMLERGHRLQVGTQGIVGYVASAGKPRIALDVGEEAVYFDNPYLPETRSEVGIPLIVRGTTIGVLDIQALEREAFNEDDLYIFQTLADQIAIAIENIRLLHESQLVISQLQFITDTTSQQGWVEKVSHGNSGYKFSPLGLQNLDKNHSFLKTGKTIEIPITFRNHMIGKIKLNRKPDFPNWTEQEINFAAEVASQTAQALDNIYLLEEAKRRAQRENLISEISNRVRETLDLDTVLKTSATELQTVLDLEEAEVQLFAVDDEGQVDE